MFCRVRRLLTILTFVLTVPFALAFPGSPVEVVVARHDEDVAWLAPHASPSVRIEIYDKGTLPVGDSERLPNVGRESHTYVHHIVSRYETLAEWTVFTQATQPSWGYRGHLASGIKFEDYLKPDPSGAYFVHTAAIDLNRHAPSHRTLRIRASACRLVPTCMQVDAFHAHLLRVQR